ESNPSRELPPGNIIDHLAQQGEGNVISLTPSQSKGVNQPAASDEFERTLKAEGSQVAAALTEDGIKRAKANAQTKEAVAEAPDVPELEEQHEAPAEPEANTEGGPDAHSQSKRGSSQCKHKEPSPVILL
ncbi:MAG: hypothetical protein ACKEQK_00415, partial [Candidatus Hodgkinia cicadicola]